MSHKCAVCQKEDWHDLDVVRLPCSACMGEGNVNGVVCQQCNGEREINFNLRDYEYWHDRDMIFDEKIGFKVCKNCGFVTYTPRWTEAQLREQYGRDRTHVTKSIYLAARGKIGFHKEMLKAVTPDAILDIGCSFGYLRQVFPTAEIMGIEWSVGLRKYAERVNGVILKESIEDVPDNSRDLAVIYHTLEHILDPRQMLLDIKRKLKPNGLLYVAIPDYFGLLRESSGQVCNDFEHLYHLNHQNVFSTTSITNLLYACGFTPEHFNDTFYGLSILARPAETPAKIIQSNYLDIEKRLVQQRLAIEAFTEAMKPAVYDANGKPVRSKSQEEIIAQFETALSYDPTYIDAYLGLASQVKDNYKDFKRWKEIIDRGRENCADNKRLRVHYAAGLITWSDAKDGMTPRIREAEQILRAVLLEDPMSDVILFYLLRIAANYEKDYNKARELGDKIIAINPTAWEQVQDVLGWLVSQ